MDKFDIGIIGLGYVGLPLAIEFSKKYKTYGFDISSKRVDELNNGNGQTPDGNDKDEISDTDVMEIHQVDNKYGNDEFLEDLLDGVEQSIENVNQNVAGQVDDTLGRPVQRPIKGRRRHTVTFDSDVEIIGSDNSENGDKFANENKNTKQCMYCSYKIYVTRYMYNTKTKQKLGLTLNCGSQ